MNLTFSEFDSYKLTTEFGGGCYTHTTRWVGGIKTEKWERRKRIGRGAFGTVWKEMCVQSGAVRAVKQIRKLDMKGTGEVLALTRMDSSRHFVQFFGWFQDEKYIYLAMEYVECGDLEQLILEDKLSEGDIKLVTRQLLEGLKIMHENNFCHRDLKPQNVLVSKWIPLTVKISDFGITKHVGDNTELRTFAGSPGYAAPEIWGYLRSDTSVYTNAVDIWSLGCLIYAMITQETPFPAARDLLDYIEALISFPEAKLMDRASTAIGFITSLVKPNPQDRLDVEQALKHPWLEVENHDAQTFWPELPIMVVPVKFEQGQVPDQVAPAKSTPEKSPNIVAAAEPELKQNPVRPNGQGQALILAAKEGHLNVVQLLLKKGADLTATDNYGYTPLHWAARNGHLEVVQSLLEKGADTMATDKSGCTPLHRAVQNGHLEVVQSLLEKGADITARSKGDNTPLSLAALNGKTEVVRFLLENGVDAMERTFPGYTALHCVAQEGHLEVALLLLERGVDITATDEHGCTPLHQAAQNGHLEVVQSLLEKGADMTATDKDDCTPLDWASQGGHLEVVQFLLEADAY